MSDKHTTEHTIAHLKNKIAVICKCQTESLNVSSFGQLVDCYSLKHYDKLNHESTFDFERAVEIHSPTPNYLLSLRLIGYQNCCGPEVQTTRTNQA